MSDQVLAEVGMSAYARPSGEYRFSRNMGSGLGSQVALVSAGSPAQYGGSLHAYLALNLDPLESRNILLCDPLTGLVGYPSFEEYVISNMPRLGRETLHVAIGDVDDLRSYVTAERFANPLLYGHLAGNSCMRTVGSTVRKWSCERMVDWPLLICGTFGGDEVIIAASGLRYQDFKRQVEALCVQIGTSAPRPCSFACGTLGPASIAAEDAEDAYRHLITSIDRVLFDHKRKSRSSLMPSAGEVIDCSLMNLARDTR